MRQDVRAAMAVNRSEVRKRLLPEMRDIPVDAVAPRRRSPDASNHRNPPYLPDQPDLPDDPTDVERFAKADPYVVNGLVKDWRVREWAVVVGDYAVPR